MVIFDPQVSGHHREFLRHLWAGAGLYAGEGTTVGFIVHPTVLDSERFLSEGNRYAAGLLPALAGDGITLPGTHQARNQLTAVIGSSGEGPVHIFFPRLNAYLRALERPGLLPHANFTVSGILFGPASAAWCHRGGGGLERLKAFHELLRLRRLRRTAGLRRLHILNDPRTARFLQRFVRLPEGIRPLADPVPETGGRKPEIRGREAGGRRQGSKISHRPSAISHSPSELSVTFLLPGVLRAGKGVIEWLDALRTWVPPPGGRVRLVLAGDVRPAFRQPLADAARRFRHAQRALDLVIETGFLSEAAFLGHLRGADFLVLPYTRPMGSSGILGHAAREGIPVLATRNGLIGTLVRDYRLGDVFPVKAPDAIRRAHNRALAGQVVLDPGGRARYLHDNSVESFQQAVFAP